ncbi:SprT family zinc-dependent metalloprotease [Oceanisphaera sp. IT1-181]|uniref:SprT family zinc-dependent metalloprotease n=1 Tax=Oceanisphaera sp. IT1-181 TaxID=3081199 RepID=UPI0029CA4061|nr:SprT family zinc-dependent metalloprotease [Oceanisphaera sp. IT1-181]
MTSDIQQRIITHVQDCMQLAATELAREFAQPLVRFNQGGRIAGSAWLERWELRFNPVLLADNEAEFMDEIVPHEVAHLVTFACFGKVKPHGREWQHIMQSVFGLTPRTRHQLDTSKVAPTFSYQCACRSHQLTLRRHNKIMRAQQRYLCLHCNGLLQKTLAPSTEHQAPS